MAINYSTIIQLYFKIKSYSIIIRIICLSMLNVIISLTNNESFFLFEELPIILNIRLSNTINLE
jgi:hypothetical protein